MAAAAAAGASKKKGNSFAAHYCSATFPPRAVAAYYVVDVVDVVEAAVADSDVAVARTRRLDSSPSIPPPPHPLSRTDPPQLQSLLPPLPKTAPRPRASCPCTKTPRTGPGADIYNHNTLFRGEKKGSFIGEDAARRRVGWEENRMLLIS